MDCIGLEAELGVSDRSEVLTFKQDTGYEESKSLIREGEMTARI